MSFVIEDGVEKSAGDLELLVALLFSDTNEVVIYRNANEVEAWILKEECWSRIGYFRYDSLF